MRNVANIDPNFPNPVRKHSMQPKYSLNMTSKVLNWSFANLQGHCDLLATSTTNNCLDM